MNRLKKIILSAIIAVVFVLGVIAGDLFSLYIPFEPVQFKSENKENTNDENQGENNTGENEDKAQDIIDNKAIEEAAEKILSSMTLDEKIYQLMFVTPESITGVGTCIQAGEATKTALENMPVGGIIYFEKNADDALQLTEMISNTQSFSKIPLFIGVDEEGGAVRRLGKNEILGMTEVGDMADIGKKKDTILAYETAKTIAREIKEFGFNVDFAPVCDVLTNSENTVVSRRSFGSDKDIVSKMSLSFVYGLQDNGVSACLKHFPGHGGTSGDTHDGYSENSGAKEDILKNETEAFRAGIENGCDFVMTGHISIPSITESGIPCSLSDKVVKDILKDEFGFEGIVITDALNMGAIKDNYSVADSAVMAISAGNDMILMPENVSEAFEAIKQNIGSKISEERINDSVKRILKVKIKRGIIEI